MAQENYAGLSEAFFTRVLRLFAADHGKLVGLPKVARLVVRYGDDPALGHRCVAIIDRVKGRWIPSAEAFIRAGDSATHPRDQLAFKTGAIDGLARGGRVQEAIALGQSLIEGLTAEHEDGLAARASLNVAYALMQQDRYQEAWQTVSGLPERLLSAGYETDAASARLAQSTSLLFGGDVSQAREAAERAASEAEALGLDQLANIARGNIAYADLLAGDPDLAISALVELREKNVDAPVEMARSLEYLGDAFSAMNLWIEAVDAYRETLALGSVVQPLHQAHLHLGIGQTLMASGQAEAGLVELAKASRRYLALGNRVWHAAAETDRAEAERFLGKKIAKPRIESAVREAREAGSPYHLCRALISSASGGGPDSHLDEAAAILRRNAFPRLVWRVHAERARRATGAGRLKHHRRMLAAVIAEQARISSYAARLGHLRDKAEALRTYLDDLLAHPTPAHVKEAIGVVSRSRAVTLLDELLRGRSTELPPEAAERLRALRVELNEGESDNPTQGTRRRSGTHDRLDRMQRKWVEETISVERSATLAGLLPVSDSLVMVEGSTRLRALTTSGVVEFGDPDLAGKLEWLAYDLLSPMLDRKADPIPAMEGLRQLGETLLRPLLRHGPALGICPEGTLWRVPWLACLDAIGAESDLELRMHPGLRGKDPSPGGKGAMLWVAEHQDLPWVGEEAKMFLRYFPGAQVCRTAEEARKGMVNADVSILHVISHARHRWRHPMFSSLDFTDGPVLAAEIARSGLRAELVTLSGCDTGRLSDTNHHEPDGLVRAFLACGAGFVVGSAWPLDDEAAVHLYQSFYNSISKDLNVHVSLRKARQDVQNWQSHPYFWASPLLYGGYRS
ncbi:hypothetical protein OP10G_1377 [Fimbriimonas ginsengisoli Gsoil 348]|uniref:CHAT domain-containing protein n=1 Tax=Fimbriimonas ginsengisoli Gsoil 348 TaxID=661478 RepID=A0A068NPQ7_FIMGI|nr:hypothetical protein OP10G_1377 [Fimbriimonas ginsengisoli Gsoil 348]